MLEGVPVRGRECVWAKKQRNYILQCCYLHYVIKPCSRLISILNMRLRLETPILAQRARWSDAFYNINLYISEKQFLIFDRRCTNFYRRHKIYNRHCEARAAENKKEQKWGFMQPLGVNLGRETGVIRKIIIIFATNVALPPTLTGVTKEKSNNSKLNNKTN